MNYILKPSLKRIALVKEATLLWNQNDIRGLITNLYFSSDYEELLKKWEKVEQSVMKKVTELPVPHLLKEKISNVIRPIGLRILKWMIFIYESSNIKITLPKEFHWSVKGTIDEMRTAQAIISDENMDIATRYKLSCVYCLQNDIEKLWKEMPEKCRKSICSGEDLMHEKEDKLVVFWTYLLRKEITKLRQLIKKTTGRRYSPCQYGINTATLSGNKVATEYFLQQLSQTGRKKSLVNVAMNCAHGFLKNDLCCHGNLKEYYSDVFCFLLSQMDEEQQISIFASHHILVMMCLLEWPHQAFFLETTNRMWNFLSADTFAHILRIISYKMLLRYKDYDYKQLFIEFWEKSPSSYKRCLMIHIDDNFVRTLFNFLKLGHLDIVKFIFQDSTVEQKKELIFHHEALDGYSDLIAHEKWDSLKFFITQCLPTKEMMVKAKDDFVNKKMWSDRYAFYIQRKQKFIDILSDLISKFNKRKRLDDDNDPTEN